MTFEIFDQSDEETWPDQKKDNDKDEDKDKDKVSYSRPLPSWKSMENKGYASKVYRAVWRIWLYGSIRRARCTFEHFVAHSRAGRAVQGQPLRRWAGGWAEEKNGKEDKLEPMQSRAEKWEYFFDALREHKLDRAPLEST